MTKSSLFVIVVKYHSSVPSGIQNLIVVDNDKINRGFAAGANIGIKKALTAGADRVLLLNPDIKITPEQIATLANTTGDVVSPVLVSNGKYDYGGKINWFLGRTTHGHNKNIDYVSGACMLIKRNVLEKIGLFDERFFMYFEDADFCLRAKKAGFKVSVNPNLIIRHKLTKNKQKYSYVLQSNFKFVNRWIPWYFRPLSYLYLLFLWLKTR